MNEKPQRIREAGQEDLLEQIITQGLDKMNVPAQAAAASEVPRHEAPPAPQREDSEKAAPSTEKEPRRSAVYLYLLILFGAAFLLLLLAYFIQQRSSSDLRDSMNLSREELLEEIKNLQEKNAALIGNIDRLNDDLIQWQKRYDEKDGEATVLWNQYYDAKEELYSWQSFWTLERYYQAEDYESCAALFLLLAQSQYGYVTPADTEARQLEILNTVVSRGLLDEEYYLHPEDYQELLDTYFSNATRLTDLHQTDWVE